MENRIKLNDLDTQNRLDLIWEAREQHLDDHVDYCIVKNVPISQMCEWSKTRQGFKYWNAIDLGLIVNK